MPSGDRMKYIFLSLFLVLSSIITHADPITIRIASPNLSVGQNPAGGGVVDVLYANKILEKEFAKDNVKVEWYFFKGAGPAINEALANHQIDFAFLGDFPSIIGKARGLDTQLLVPTMRDVTNYLVVRSDLNFNHIDDIKDKNVGLLRGTADDLSFTLFLQSHNLSYKDVKIINMNFNAVNAALVAKKIDISWGPARYFMLKDRGLVKMPMSTKQVGNAGASQGVFLGSQTFTKAYPQLTQRIVNKIVEQQKWLATPKNLNAQIALFSQQSGYPRSIYLQDLNGVNLSTLYSPIFDDTYMNNLKQKVSVAKAHHLIRQDINVETWINPVYVQHALLF